MRKIETVDFDNPPRLLVGRAEIAAGSGGTKDCAEVADAALGKACLHFLIGKSDFDREEDFIEGYRRLSRSGDFFNGDDLVGVKINNDFAIDVIPPHNRT